MKKTVRRTFEQQCKDNKKKQVKIRKQVRRTKRGEF